MPALQMKTKLTDEWKEPGWGQSGKGEGGEEKAKTAICGLN